MPSDFRLATYFLTDYRIYFGWEKQGTAFGEILPARIFPVLKSGNGPSPFSGQEQGLSFTVFENNFRNL